MLDWQKPPDQAHANIAKLLQKKKPMEDTGGDYIDQDEAKGSPNARKGNPKTKDSLPPDKPIMDNLVRGSSRQGGKVAEDIFEGMARAGGMVEDYEGSAEAVTVTVQRPGNMSGPSYNMQTEVGSMPGAQLPQIIQKKEAGQYTELYYASRPTNVVYGKEKSMVGLGQMCRG